jgi:hypothetical protein
MGGVSSRALKAHAAFICGPFRLWSVLLHRNARTVPAQRADRQLCWTDPVRGLQCRSSTTWAHHQEGQPLLRFLLGEAAQAAARCDSDWRRRYMHLVERRQRNIARLAMARRLAVRLYWMRRNGETNKLDKLNDILSRGGRTYAMIGCVTDDDGLLFLKTYSRLPEEYQEDAEALSSLRKFLPTIAEAIRNSELTPMCSPPGQWLQSR